MVFKNVCLLAIKMKVASALELGLNRIINANDEIEASENPNHP